MNMGDMEIMWKTIKEGDLEKLKKMIEFDPSWLKKRDPNNYTLLSIALHQDVRQEEIAAWLMEQDIDLDVQNVNGFNALILCCRYWMPETATKLINKGASLDLATTQGFTPLISACRNSVPGIPGVIRLLIEKGASLDLRNTWGNTALMSACYKPDPSTEGSTEPLMLEAMKICYAAGARTDFTTFDTQHDCLALSRTYQLKEHERFLEFAIHSQLSRVLLYELKMPRSLIIALQEDGLTRESKLKDISYEKVNGYKVLTPAQVRKFLDKFNPSAAGGGGGGGGGGRPASRRKSLFQAIGLGGRKKSTTSGGKEFDAFLTHDWGKDEMERDNHMRVKGVNETLKANGIRTWFDSEKLRGDIVQQIMSGIEKSKRVVVFITERYMNKLNKKHGVDYCKSEFSAATHLLGPQNMIPVVMEPKMLDQNSWIGPLQFHLGSTMYIDFSTAVKVQTNMDKLISAINEK